jgi:hypothetical protein
LCLVTGLAALSSDMSLMRASEAPPLLGEAAVVSHRPEAAPRRSAVCFSSRWIHPVNSNDPRDTFAVASAFHATDFVWIYTLDAQAVTRMKGYGGHVFLAINSLVPDAPGTNERLRGRILDLEGNRVTAPWMRGWQGSYWGCANSPEYRVSYLAYARKALDAGASGLQMDDPPMNLAAVKWGGCFCPHCLQGFRSYLQEHSEPADWRSWDIQQLADFDYRAYLRDRGAPVGDLFAKYAGGRLKELFEAFQQESVRAFYQDARAAIDAHAGRHVIFASNNYAGRWQFPYDLFEIGMAEIPERDATPNILYARLAEAGQRGKAQLFTLVPKTVDGSEVRLTRQVIATAYACGGHLIVPWDVYTGSNTPRYFGEPRAYADLYQFAREQAALLDDYEDAAFLLSGVRDERYPADAPWAAAAARDVAVFARAKPRDPLAPVAVHVVDWRAESQPFTLELATRRFARQGSLRVELLRPGSSPATITGSDNGGRTSIEIPAVTPWGILRVSAQP